MPDPPKFSFGSTPTSSGAQTPTLFGGSSLPGKTSNAPSGGSLFGNVAPSSGSGSNSSPFGQPSTGFSFGGLGKKPEESKSSNTGGFNIGTPAKPPTISGLSTGGIGGAGSSTTSTLAPAGSTTPAPASTPNLFSFGSTTPAGPPPSKSTGPAPAGGLFNLGGQQLSSGSSQFGAQKPSQAPAPSAPTGSLFSSTTQPATSSDGSAPSLFGTKTASSTSTPTPQFTLGKPSTTTEQKPADSASKPPGFSFTPAAPTTTAFSTASSAPAPSGGLFNNLGKSTASSPAPAPAPAPASTPASSGGLFSLGQPAASSAPTTSAPIISAAPTSGLFAPKSAAASAVDSSKPAAFGPTTTTATATAANPAPTLAPAAASAASTTNLGASTAGPLPPSQSRLKNKTMDEIITRWATDLTKYQKEFQAQAEQVATWDQMLVENMAKISKLYVATATAEKQTSSVEMQLTAVENQQEELSSWLDRYEKEVDEMMGKSIGGDGALQGVDQERERTYKLAEKLSERLDEMGKDLTTMIEDINAASASLSKQTKSDEPISQIVRILNSHLTQLQAIDQGTTALQAKIAAAQKSGRDIVAGNAGNGYGQGHGRQGGAVEDFYKSYMGRR